LTYGIITWLTDGDQRTAILSTSVMFVMGLLLLLPMNVDRASNTARQSDEEATATVVGL
jgi:UMF1 family MFS transporter